MKRFKKKFLLNKSSEEFDSNPYKKLNFQSYPMNFQISNFDLENSLNSCILINQYIDLNNEALSHILNSQVSEALSCYEKASHIANQLNYNFKKKELECNKGIAFYHLNDIKTAIKLLQSCYDYFYKICCEGNNENENIDMKNLTLLCKAGANLCMCKITLLNNKNYCINLIKDIINIISQESDINNQTFYLTYLSNILFNVNNLLPQNSNTILNSLDEDEDNKDELYKIDQSFYELFFNFIATNDIDTWNNSLEKIIQKLEKYNNQERIIKMLLNQILAKCLKYSDDEEQNENNDLTNEELLNEEKLKLKSLFKIMNQMNNKKEENDINDDEEEVDFDDEYINNIINEYKYKLSVIREIYQIISCQKIQELWKADPKDHYNLLLF